MNALEIGESLSLVLIDAAAKSTVLLVGAWLATFVLRRSSAAVRHRVWGLAMGGLVLLPALSWLLPAWRLPILPARAEQVSPRVVESQTEPEQQFLRPHRNNASPNDEFAFARPTATADLRSMPADTHSLIPSPTVPQSSAAPTPIEGKLTSTMWVLAVAVIVWSLGASLLLAGVALGIRRTGRLWRGSQTITDEAWGRLARELCARLGLRRPVHLREHAEPVVPLTWGLLRPIILLPEQARCWSDSMRRAVLLHELAHVYRGDVAYQLLGRFACALYWFHPLAWFGLHQLRQEREHACDDAVIGSGERASDYAEQLLEVARRYRRAGGLALAVEITHGGSLEQRVRALFDAARSHAPIGRCLAIALLAVTGIFVSAIAVLRPVAAEVKKLGVQTTITAKTPEPAGEQSTTAAPKAAAVERNSADKAAAESRVATHPVTISGVARNKAGEPIPRATVYLLSTLYENSRRVAETTTNEKGAYVFHDAPLPVVRPERNSAGSAHGAFEILGVADGYGFAWRPRKVLTLAPRPAPGDETLILQDRVDSPYRFWLNDPLEFDLEFPAASQIEGRVVDELGRPVVGVKLDLRLCERVHDEIEAGVVASAKIYDLTALNQPEDVPAAIKSCKTDAQGRFAFGGLPPECLFRLDVRHPDYAGQDVWAATTSETLPKLGGRWPILTGKCELVFQAVQDVKVRVVDADTGHAVPGVLVSAGSVGISAGQTSDSEGEVTLRVPPGDYAVELLPATGTPYLHTKIDAVLAVLPKPANNPAVVKLRRACVLEVTIIDADTALPIPDVDLWIDPRENPDESGPAVKCSDVYFRSWDPPTARVERPVSDKNGKLRALVEPGRRRLGASFAKAAPWYAPDRQGQLFDCQAGQTLHVEFQLRKIISPQKVSAAVEPSPAGDARRATDSADHFQRFNRNWADARRLINVAKKPKEALPFLEEAIRELPLVTDEQLLTENWPKGVDAVRIRSSKQGWLIDLLLTAGGLDQAVKLVNEIQSPGIQAEALAKIAVQLAARGQRAAAIRYLDQALTAAPKERAIPEEFAHLWGDREATWQLMGLLAVGDACHQIGEVDRYGQVLKLMQKVRGKKGDALELLLRVAHRQWERKDEPGMQQTLVQVTEACETEEWATDAIAGFWNDVCSDFLENGKFDDVLAHLDKLDDNARNRQRVVLVRGWARNNQLERAAAELKRISEPRSRATAMVFLARGEAAAGRKEAAASLLTEATELVRGESNPFAKTVPLVLAVETLALWGDYATAERDAKQINATIPADSLVYSIYNGSHSDYYEMPFQILVGPQTCWLLIARAQVRAGKIDEAMKTIDRLPDIPGAKFMVERYRAYILSLVARELLRTGNRTRVQKLLETETIPDVREAIEAELTAADSEPPAKAATDAKPESAAEILQKVVDKNRFWLDPRPKNLRYTLTGGPAEPDENDNMVHHVWVSGKNVRWEMDACLGSPGKPPARPLEFTTIIRPEKTVWLRPKGAKTEAMTDVRDVHRFRQGMTWQTAFHAIARNRVPAKCEIVEESESKEGRVVVVETELAYARASVGLGLYQLQFGGSNWRLDKVRLHVRLPDYLPLREEYFDPKPSPVRSMTVSFGPEFIQVGEHVAPKTMRYTQILDEKMQKSTKYREWALQGDFQEVKGVWILDKATNSQDGKVVRQMQVSEVLTAPIPAEMFDPTALAED